jgi:hypothetical protein
MDLFMAATQGIGLGLASGLRSFLPPLLAGVLARANAGIDLDGTGYEFVESTWFLAAVVGLNVLAVLHGLAVKRSRPIPALGALLLACGIVLGALLFAASLDEAGESPWPGLAAGAACALLAVVVSRQVFAGASRRSDGSAGLEAYFDAAAIVLAAVAIFLSPVSLVALAGLAWLALARRSRQARKYEGLRILR